MKKKHPSVTEQYMRWRSHAENVFSMYNVNKHRLFVFTQDIVYGRRVEEGMPRNKTVTSPTEQAAIAIATNPRMAEIRREIDAVDRVLLGYGGPRHQFIRKVLIQRRMTEEQASEYFGISTRTCVHWKKDACVKLARILGWLDED